MNDTENTRSEYRTQRVPYAACQCHSAYDRGRYGIHHPDRSQRGRIITHTHWFDLPLKTLPAVAGADDAADARWFPIDGLARMEAKMFEDHFTILERFLKITEM